MESVGNTLAAYVKTSEVTKASKYTSHAWIYIYMNVYGALLDPIQHVNCQYIG